MLDYMLQADLTHKLLLIICHIKFNSYLLSLYHHSSPIHTNMKSLHTIATILAIINGSQPIPLYPRQFSLLHHVPHWLLLVRHYGDGVLELQPVEVGVWDGGQLA